MASFVCGWRSKVDTVPVWVAEPPVEEPAGALGRRWHLTRTIRSARPSRAELGAPFHVATRTDPCIELQNNADHNRSLYTKESTLVISLELDLGGGLGFPRICACAKPFGGVRYHHHQNWAT